MKKNLIMSAMAFAALAFAGCSQDEVLVESSSANKPIEFGTYLGRPAHTRAIATTTASIKEEGKGFGVSAFYTGQKEWNDVNTADEKLAPNFMWNEHVTWTGNLDDGSWHYDNLKYWPTKKNDKISFFAYAPYAADGKLETTNSDGTQTTVVQMSGNDEQGTPTVTYTVPDDVRDMVDFVADAMIDRIHTYEFDKTDDNNSVKKNTVVFKLNHELTRIGFKAVLDENFPLQNGASSQTRVVITDLSIQWPNASKFYKTAKYTFADKNDSYADDGTRTHVEYGTWSNYGDGITSAFAIAEILDKKTHEDVQFMKDSEDTELKTINGIWLNPAVDEPTTLLKDGNYLYFIPIPANDVTSEDKITAKITYSIITEDSNLQRGFSLTTDDTKEVTFKSAAMAQGVSYNYIFKIGIDEIKVEASVAEWSTVSDGEQNEIDYRQNAYN